MDFKEMRLPIEVTDKMVGGPMWSTRIFGVQSGDESRLGLWAYPLHKWDISEAGRTLDSAQATKIIHMRARGMLYGFRALDPLDFTVYQGQGALVATATAGVYQLVKVYTMDGDTFVRPIKKPIPGQCVVIGPDGYALSADPIDYTSGLATIASVTDITAYSWLGCFDVPVRFTDDWLQVGKDTGLLAWKNAHIREIRRVDVSTGTPPPIVFVWDFGPPPLYYAPPVNPSAPAPAPAPAPTSMGATLLTSGVTTSVPPSSSTQNTYYIATGSSSNVFVQADSGGEPGMFLLYRKGQLPDPDTGAYDGYFAMTGSINFAPSEAGDTYYFMVFHQNPTVSTGITITVTLS